MTDEKRAKEKRKKSCKHRTEYSHIVTSRILSRRDDYVVYYTTFRGDR